MYTPREFAENRPEVLHELIRRLRLGLLVTVDQGELDASLIPMIFEPEPGPLGRLTAHVARANQQWRNVSKDISALAIFQGPHHYVSPSWYPSKAEHGRAVPTWNYVVVQARGRLRAIQDVGWLRSHLETLVTREEAAFQHPWRISDAPAEYIEATLKGIVGLELSLESLEGKFKLSQNRPKHDRDSVAAHLRSANAVELASEMEASKPERVL